MDAGEGEPYSPIAQPSSPTSRQRRYRLHAAQSVSCPRLLNMAVGQNLKHSESAKNLYESNSSSGRKKGGKKVTIVDPKSGRDVTEEILRKGRERPKEPWNNSLWVGDTTYYYRNVDQRKLWWWSSLLFGTFKDLGTINLLIMFKVKVEGTFWRSHWSIDNRDE